MTTGFFSWRWAPAILLVGGATALSVAAVVFIPSSIGAPAATRTSTLVTPAHEEASHANEEGAVEAAVATAEPPRRRAKRKKDSTPTTGVESFFPAEPPGELPPPLPDDPVPPEPAETAVNRDAFGPGVEPASIPPP